MERMDALPFSPSSRLCLPTAPLPTPGTAGPHAASRAASFPGRLRGAGLIGGLAPCPPSRAPTLCQLPDTSTRLRVLPPRLPRSASSLTRPPGSVSSLPGSRALPAPRHVHPAPCPPSRAPALCQLPQPSPRQLPAALCRSAARAALVTSPQHTAPSRVQRGGGHRGSTARNSLLGGLQPGTSSCRPGSRTDPNPVPRHAGCSGGGLSRGTWHSRTVQALHLAGSTEAPQAWLRSGYLHDFLARRTHLLSGQQVDAGQGQRHPRVCGASSSPRAPSAPADTQTLLSSSRPDRFSCSHGRAWSTKGLPEPFPPAQPRACGPYCDSLLPRSAGLAGHSVTLRAWTVALSAVGEEHPLQLTGSTGETVSLAPRKMHLGEGSQTPLVSALRALVQPVRLHVLPQGLDLTTRL